MSWVDINQQKILYQKGLMYFFDRINGFPQKAILMKKIVKKYRKIYKIRLKITKCQKLYIVCTYDKI